MSAGRSYSSSPPHLPFTARIELRTRGRPQGKKIQPSDRHNNGPGRTPAGPEHRLRKRCDIQSICSFPLYCIPPISVISKTPKALRLVPIPPRNQKPLASSIRVARCSPAGTFMKPAPLPAPCLGVIYGNRDFFPDHLVTEARTEIGKLCEKLGIRTVQLGEKQSKLGGVETHADARKCAALFKKNADDIDGVLVVLPNFGDEKGVADTLKLAGLDVPVLVQGYPDNLKQLDVARRRDAYCGKISVCNNLVQAGIRFSVTHKHVVQPSHESFIADLKNFLAVCRVVNGLRGLRLGAVGARPGAFNTVRYSEKILERHGISVTTVDLSEILGQANKLDANAKAVKARL